MTNLSLRRTIDTIRDEITTLIADELLGRAWSKYHALCDMIECEGLGWDDETTAYWNQATDKAYGECRTAENLALGLLPSYTQANVQNGAPEEPFLPVIDYADFWDDENECPVQVKQDVKHDA